MNKTSNELASACDAHAWDRVQELAGKLPKEELNKPLTSDDWRALHFAAAGGAGAAVRALLASGADPTVKAKAGSTPLHLAAWEGREPSVIALLDSGADANAKSLAGRTPVHFAARRGHAHICVLLAAANADVNAIERDGRTPLHFAAREGARKAVEALLKAGATPAIKDKTGKTPAEAAKEGEKVEVAEAVEKAERALGATIQMGPTEKPARRPNSGWGSLVRRSVSDVTTFLSSGFVVEGSGTTAEVRAHDDSSVGDGEKKGDGLSRKEVYTVVGAGVLMSAIIPAIRNRSNM